MSSQKTSPEKIENWEDEFDNRMKRIDGILQVKLLYTIGGIFLIFIIIWLILIIWFRQDIITSKNMSKKSNGEKIILEKSPPLK